MVCFSKLRRWQLWLPLMQRG
jgi:hypothetical protein